LVKTKPKKSKCLVCFMFAPGTINHIHIFTPKTQPKNISIHGGARADKNLVSHIKARFILWILSQEMLLSGWTFCGAQTNNIQCYKN